MNLQFVKHSDINQEKWDVSIAQCYNENPYAYSQWLNIVCAGWCAMVSDNYDVLIPLPVKSKLGIRYIAQPKFTQQLGIFSHLPLDEEFIKNALNRIPVIYLKIYLQLNIDNSLSSKKFKSRPTFCLPLNQPYETLYQNFSSHHKRNITKAIERCNKKQVHIVESTDKNLFLKLFKETVGQKDRSLVQSDYDLMSKIISSTNGKIVFCMNETSDVICGLFYLESSSKIVNLFNFILPEGKDKKAMYYVLNYWIKSYSGQLKTLDFEGSEIDSIARFYSGFGATKRNYHIFTKKGFWLT